MPFTPPGIVGTSFKSKIYPSVISPFVNSIPINFDFTFNEMSNLIVQTDSYTPNNDYATLMTGLTADTSPNFIMFLCDRQANLRVDATSPGSGGYLMLNDMPVSKFLFLPFLIQPPTSYVTTIYLIGRTNDPVPMEQGVTVNYTMITGRANIT